MSWRSEARALGYGSCTESVSRAYLPTVLPGSCRDTAAWVDHAMFAYLLLLIANIHEELGNMRATGGRPLLWHRLPSSNIFDSRCFSSKTCESLPVQVGGKRVYALSGTSLHLAPSVRCAERLKFVRITQC